MPNPFFAFKAFTVYQRYAAMKVTTDACLFGSMLGTYCPANATKALDIGTGTGLLSLMLLQQHPNLRIDAVEIDALAASEAKTNVSQSPWPSQMHIHQQPIQEYESTDTYDFIFSNPPFYEKHLPSEKALKNIALHSNALSLNELIIAIKRLLSEEGKFSILLPYFRKDEAINLLKQQQFIVHECVAVKQTTAHDYFRIILTGGRNVTADAPDEKNISIKDAANQYTNEFVQLLQPYYLYL